jgi:DNA adenine methylase
MEKCGTLLKRIGNKDRIVFDIIKYFPAHSNYVELFFGAGACFFTKPKAKYSFLNDIDSEVINFYQVIKERPKEFQDELEDLPVDENLFHYWRKNKETDPLKKALRFLMLSNFGMYGKSETLRLCPSNLKNMALRRIIPISKLLDNTMLFNASYNKALNKLNSLKGLQTVFIYADPPYINTTSNYREFKWDRDDFKNLIENLLNFETKFAISEFKNDIVIDIIKKYKELNFIEVINRRSLNNRSTEILIRNYKEIPNSLFELY